MTRRPGIRLDETDTVVTLLDDADAGDAVAYGDDETLELAEDVPFGHKVALCEHETDDEVLKYGEVIGAATEPIDAGEWVHTHNCTSLRGQVSGVGADDANAHADADADTDTDTDADANAEVTTE